VIRVQAAHPSHFGWLAERAGLVLRPGFGAIEAVDETGRILAMVGYEAAWPETVTMHVAVEHPYALRHILRPGFGTAFESAPRGLGKRAATITVLSTNPRSLALVRHLGFRHIHTGKNYAGGGVDIEFFEMKREDCRFLPRAVRKAA
jgi:hypothetical protein